MSKFENLHKLVRHETTDLRFFFTMSANEIQNAESFVQFSGFAQL